MESINKINEQIRNILRLINNLNFSILTQKPKVIDKNLLENIETSLIECYRTITEQINTEENKDFLLALFDVHEESPFAQNLFKASELFSTYFTSSYGASNRTGITELEFSIKLLLRSILCFFKKYKTVGSI